MDPPILLCSWWSCLGASPLPSGSNLHEFLVILNWCSWAWNHGVPIGCWTTKLLFLKLLLNLLTLVVIIITSILSLSPYCFISYYNSLNTKPYSSLLLLLIICFIKLLQRCCNSPPFLLSNLSLLLNLFLKIYCPTQVHTLYIQEGELTFPLGNCGEIYLLFLWLL